MRQPHPLTSGPNAARFTTLWNAHQPRMMDLAFRMLLDLRDAEDVVQEAFSRLARSELTTIDDPEGWLVVVTSRLCLDRLRTRRRHPTEALQIADDPFDRLAVDPSSHVTLADNIMLAMHTVLERLSPAQRTSFVLHDVFQYPYDDIAAIVGRTPASCRQLASRARRTLLAESSPTTLPVDLSLQRDLSERFIAACAGGDLEGLLRLLDPDVDGNADVVAGVVVGADNVAPGILRYLGPPSSPTLLSLPIGDRIGIVVLHDHTVRALVVLTVGSGLVVHVDALAGEAPRAAVTAVLGLD